MNRRISTFFIVSLLIIAQSTIPTTTHTTIPTGARLVDTIDTVLYTDNNIEIITSSEVNRPGIDGSERSRDDLVFEKLMFEDARKFNMTPSEDDIDKHLKNVQKENNLTREQLKGVFTSAGYTYEEGRQQFEMLTTINTILDFKVRSKLIISEKDVIEFWEKNPIKQAESYCIQRAEIPVADKDEERSIRKKIIKYFKTKTGLDVTWSTPIWVEKDQLAEDKAFIAQMSTGDISRPQKIKSGFEIFKLADKRPEIVVSLDDRYNEITNALRKPKYIQLVTDYQNELLEAASIEYL